MKIKSTKRAFIASALALLLCASMLIGTTFAWFTDSVESGINTIQSGNLDVELYYTDSADVAKDPDSKEWKKVDANTNVFGYNNWEPGFTKVVYFKVENEGSLALKYQLSADVDSEKAGINKDGKEFLLSDYIYTKVVDTDATRDAILASTDGVKIKGSIPMNNAGNLEKGENNVIGFAIWMPTDVGNVANHNGTEEGTPQITFGINLIATQKMSENDSFGPDYDEDAWDDAMKVYSATDLKAALANDGSAIVMNDIELAQGEQIVIPEETKATLNLNGNTLSGNITKGDGAVLVNNGSLTIVGGEVTNTASNGDAAIDNDGTLTLVDVSVVGATIADGGYPEYAVQTSGTLIVEDGTSICGDRGAISIDGNGATTINGGVFTVNNINYGLTSHVVDLSDDVTGEHILTINGGTFQHLNEKTSGGVVICNRTKNTVLVNGGSFTGGNYYGNDNLSDYGYGGTFSVVGGTYDAKPANKYIADGHTAMDNGDGTYTVIPEISGVTLTTVAGYPALYTDGTNYYTYTATGLISMRNFWKANCYGNNMWGKSYNVMADIDATGYTWDEVWVVVGNNANDGFVFDGHGHTVKGLTINGALFSGTPNGGNAGTEPGYVKDITFDDVTVFGDHFTGVLWSSTYGDLVIENVKVINSEITGACNVAALVGGTAQESGDVNVTFKNCAVENNTIIANGKNGQDLNGANAFISRAYADTNLVFEGENVAKNNEIVNKNGLVGGGIYGYTVWMDGGFIGTDTCDSFTNWNGLVFERVEDVKGLYKTAEKCYGVTTAEGLAKINEWFCGTAAENTTILKIDLFADIDMTGKTWNTVGWNKAYKFEEIDGNGYTISNMKLSGNAMFANFGGADVTITDLTFDNATVSTSSINSAIIVGQTYTNLTLDNVDVINSSVTGGYKVAVLVGSVHDDSATTGSTLTVKNCDIDKCTVTTVSYDFDTCGIVAYVYAGQNEKVVFENTTISNTKLMCTNSAGYDLHAFVYGTESNWYNEAVGVTVTNVTFENI